MATANYQKSPARGPQIRRGTVAIDPPSIGAGAVGTVSVTIAGVKATDIVSLEAPATLEAGLIPKTWRAKTNGVDLDILNYTGGAIDGASRTWTYKIQRTL